MHGIAARARDGLRVFAAPVLICFTTSLSAVTISEIHYNPPGSATGLEFIELHNDTPTVVDITGWAFTEGIDFTFPKGTWIRGKGYLVVCANEAVFKAAYPNVTVAGTYVGKLDSSGETIVLSNNGGGEVVRIKYRDRGKWPSLPAGTGHTLSLRRPHYDPSEPESWAPSTLPGGTPGSANFSVGSSVDIDIIPATNQWLYKKGTVEFSAPQDAWRQVVFDSATWLSGTAGIGYGDNDDATDLSTDMPNGYISIAMRKTFSVAQSLLNQTDQLFLGVNYDDGFVAYLNGVEVARSGLPGDPGTPVSFDAAAANHEAGAEELFEIPKSLLALGSNALCVQGHNAAIGSTDFSLQPRLFRRRIAGAGKGPAGLVFNELLGRTNGPRWVELSNASGAAIDISGHFLTDDANQLDKYALPAGSTIAPGGFLVITEAQSGLDFSSNEVRLFLTLPDRSASVLGEIFENVPTDGLSADRFGYSDARSPDGTGDFAYASGPTPGAPNMITVSHDIVINEIHYNPPDQNTAGEFVELFNRSAGPVNIGGWSFSSGINYTFPEDTVMPAAGYLVIAENPAALELAHGITGALGPWEGNLANDGENLQLIDAIGNTVNEVRYADGGRWSAWADGGGSSLELIDPDQDNSFATAWDASDESAKSEWKRISYTASYSPEAESELHFLLLGAGTVHIDEVSVRRSGSPIEYIPNGDLETDSNPWLFQGTHIASHRVTDDAHAGSACLELIASGAGDAGVNKIETDTSPVLPAGAYLVSFWARWIRGCPRLISRADSRTGASLQRSHLLTLPNALGTPGAVNSVRAKLLAQAGSGNLGPVIDRVAQEPVVPSATKSVRVSARAYDSNGIASVNALYRTGGLGDGVFTTAPLFDDGLHGDGKAGDSLFAGTLPPQPTGTKVVFYLEGVDSLGASRRFPVEAPGKTLLYVVEAVASTPLVNVRVDMDNENDLELTTRLLHSDDLVDGSFVYNDEEIYYNVGLRYRGSPWGRPGDPKNFRVRFGGDRKFIHELKSVNLSRSAWAINEGMAYYAVQSTSAPDSPAPSSDYVYTRTFRNGAFHGQMALIETVDANYTDRWFPRDAGGLIMKAAARPYMNDSGVMDGVAGTLFTYYGSMSSFEFENYRWYYTQGSRQVEDRWNEQVAFGTMMDPGRTSTTVFDQSAESIIDVQQFMRVLASRVMHDDWDTVGVGGGHNAYTYFAPKEGRWKLLPWDMDNTWGNPQAKVFPEDADPGVTRLVQRPKFRRMYLRVIEEMLDRTYNPAYITAYVQQVASTAGLDPGGVLNFINQRRPVAQALLPSGDFKITRLGILAIPADWSREFYSKRTKERLTGAAPLSLSTVVVHRDGQPLAAPVTWSVTTWALDLGLESPEHDFEIFGFSDKGDLLGSDSFKIISTVGWQAPSVQLVAPTIGSAAGGTRVRITGDGFHRGARVLFGGVDATEVSVISLNELDAVTPAGSPGSVSVRVINADGQLGDLPNGFEYSSAGVFVRGDANGDGQVNLADAIRTLFHLFAGGQIKCLDAADVQNDGVVNLSDPIATLNYLFRAGTPPAAPFPTPGTDPPAPVDSLGCE